MAEGGHQKEKVFKLKDSTGLKKKLVTYQRSYQEFSLKCKQKFGISESKTVILERQNGSEVEEDSIQRLDNLSILVLRQKKASIYEEAKEMKRKLMEHGNEKVEEYVRSSVDEWKSLPLNICVIGSSGSGRSYLINVLRDIKDKKDGSFASVGTSETTYACTPYPHPKYDNIIFWDVPGVGSTRFPKETYLSDIEVDRYNFFLICSCARFKEHDLWLADEIKKRHKHFYFLYTKIDVDIYSAFRDQGEENFNSQNELATIRNYCKMYLPDNSPCFLVSSYHPTKYDFPLLLKRLFDDIPSEQRHAHVLGLCGNSKEVIEKKAKILEGGIWKIAFLSGLGGAVPGVSVLIDVALICCTAKSYREAFKLTDEEINTFAVITGVTPNLFREDAGLMMRPAMFTQAGIASLITSFAIWAAAEESAIAVAGSNLTL